MKYPISVSLMLLLFKTCIAATYYFSPAGNDQTNSGTSIASPWRSIDKLNTVDLNPGDVVLFQGGATFTGSIYLETTDMGTNTQPIMVSSYGSGRAVINAGTLPGLYAENTGGIEIRAINFIAGSNNAAPGVFFYTNRTDINMEHIVIEDIDVSGFYDYGVSIGASEAAGTKGFSNLLINRVLAHDNQGGGIASYGGSGTIFNHNNIKIANSKAYNNKGIPGAASNTGNGMFLSSTENSLIDSCEAYNNGENNTFSGGGPVGIWFFQARNSIIQNCISHNNRTQTYDGGGFDLDNACQSCIIQYCFSYNNDGAGYLMANYGINIPFTGNIIRYNISENDGQKMNRAGIILWGAGAGGAGQIKDCEIYNNTIYINQTGVLVDDAGLLNVKINNNIFYGPPGTTLVKGAVDISRILFLQNDYFSSNGTPLFNWNNINYTSLAAWRNATGQERSNGTDYGLEADPALTIPGGGREGYRLNANSLMIDAGLNLINTGDRDFYSGSNRIGGIQDIGAFERQSTLAFNLVSFMAKKKAGQINIVWDVTDEAQIKTYVLESSTDALDFKAVYEVTSGHRVRNTYQFAEAEKNNTSYRLKIFNQNGTFTISKIINVSNGNAIVTLLNTFVNGSLFFRLDNEVSVHVSLVNSFGALLKTRQYAPQYGLASWPVSNLTKGMYYLKVVTQNNQSETLRIIKK